MGLAWLLGGFLDLPRYVIALAAVSTLLLVITGLLLRRLEPELGKGLTLRWLVLVVALMPFLVFRNDNWTVALTVAAFAIALSGHTGWAGTLIGVGIASKFWPVSWVPIAWWRGRRIQALALAVVGLTALFLLRSEPVTAIQRATGVHTETVAGSVLGLTRAISGDPLEIVRTSAAYIEVPIWAHLLNLIPGGVLGLVGLRALRTEFTWPKAWQVIGSTTGAVMLASPLLSTQFMAWLAPFAATSKRTWGLALAANMASLLLIASWRPDGFGRVWWWVLAAGRNAAFLALVASLAVSTTRSLPATASPLT
jgi:hypothetical protein